MCGIFGFVATPQSQFEWRRFRSLLDDLFLLSESRGKDAAGLAAVTPEAITVLKRPLRARSLLHSAEYRTLVNRVQVAGVTAGHETLAVIGHARMVTNGTEETHENNQPVIKDGMVCLHNGIVVNDAAVWPQFPDLRRDFEVDTEAIISLVQHYRRQELPLVNAVTAAFRHLQGANSVALLTNDRNGVVLASTNGSLFFALSPSGQELIFVSEKYILEQTLQHETLKDLFAGATVIQVVPGDGYAFAFNDLRPVHFRLDAGQPSGYDLPPRRTAQAVHDLRPAAPNRAPRMTSSGWTDRDAAANAVCVEQVNAAVQTLRRCSRCLLPETFPFIDYDEQGVCNYCRRYQVIQPQGEEALHKLVEPYRKSSGEPDCLVPLSGGRDSSFGLHYLKRVLGLNPVAYTYDWGMVTDLARRNISRMCGALGIEHILLSADIRKKRENIRKNVSAWLKHPDLGTVPLFMAGDKQFFYYANLLKKQMNIHLVFFSQNDMERTDFKSGFCGIDDNYQKQFYWHLSALNQGRMALYYARQFAQNPAYLNSSLLDTAFGFVSYYLIPRDFVLLYRYLPWNEAHFSDTLRREYDWELASDTTTTWRIGDGTASFYNYIYYHMAGFTENDTLRSHQIRQGMITREDALARVAQENQPRYEAMLWYCNTVGIDLKAAITAINNAPKRFSLA
jgi:hypothetical protein